MAVSPIVLARATKYVAPIQAAAQRAGVPWWLLGAIVAVESTFTPTAFRAEPQLGLDRFGHTVGSYGLVQILPDTAAAAGITLKDSRDLYDVETNLRAGATHMSRLQGQGDGSPWGVASLYNGGSGRTVTTTTRFCLEWKPTAPVDRAKRTLDRDCARIYTALPGEYLNQPYVDQVRGYAAALQGIQSVETAVTSTAGKTIGILLLAGAIAAVATRRHA